MIDFLMFLQSFSNTVLDNVFLLISSLTGELVYIAVICAIYWCVNKNKGMIAAITLVLSFSANTLLKNMFAVPRPYTYSAVRQIDTETGYGYSFPSAHAQLSTTFAGLGMINIRKKIMYIAGILLVFLTGISRMYLGVHTPFDIIFGYIVGIAVIFVSVLLFKAEKRKNLFALILLIINTVILVLSGDNDLKSVNILFFGCIAGLFLEERFIRFEVSGNIKEKILKYITGIVVLLAVKYLSGFLGEYFSYISIGFTITFIVPLILELPKKINKLRRFS